MTRRTYGLLALAGTVVTASVTLGYFLSAGDVAGKMDSTNPSLVDAGRTIYEQHCAACHGQKLEGQPNWRTRLPTGRLPAPPHDASGHTWHHPASVLFSITKEGVEAHTPPGYQSDMPAFSGILSDSDIWAVLSYIKSTWPMEVQQKHTLMGRAAQSRN